jgi:hypothetical protein
MSAIELTPELIESWIKEPNRLGAEDANGVLHVGGCADYAYVLAHHLYARFQAIAAPKRAFAELTAEALGEMEKLARTDALSKEGDSPRDGENLIQYYERLFPGTTAALLSRLQAFAAPVAEPLEIGYTNYRGEWSMRRIQPVRLWVGSTDWHPEPGLLLEALDLDKNETRHFAVKDFGPKREAAPVAPANAQGWIVANGDKTRFRCWGDSGPEWTEDRIAALHFSRKQDAEAFCRDDEDAGYILPVAAPETQGGREDA